MSSLEQILLNLRKKTDDKKAQLSILFNENSKWLQNELDVIRALIQHNPREELSSLPRKDEQYGKKRKSPEMALEPVKFSPEQKRASVDCNELLERAGLPSDLNRLKKEQLLDELAKLGDQSYTMKNLKKDLIDGLKDLLVKKARAEAQKPQPHKQQQQSSSSSSPIRSESSNSNNVEASWEDRLSVQPTTEEPEKRDLGIDTNLDNDVAGISSSVPGAPTPVESSSVLKTPGRKGSLMAEFRSMLQNSSQPTNSTNQAIDIQSEFQARQNRHRDSQLRKSQLQCLPQSDSQSSTLSSNADLDEVQTVVAGQHNAPTSEPCAVDQSEEVVEEAGETFEMETSPVRAVVSETNTGRADEEDTVDQQAEVWQEVSSDHEGEEEQDLPGVALTEDGEQDFVEEGEVAEVQDGASSSDVPVSTVSATPSSPVVSSAPKAPSNLISAQQHLANKKPSNLVSLQSQTSFLDKPAPAKPVVAALAAAKKAKEAEELKLQQKKKEQELRAAAAANTTKSSSLNSSLNSTGGSHNSVKSAASSSSASNKVASSAASAAPSAPGAPTTGSSSAAPAQKKGIFGMFGQKKPAETVSKPTPTAAPEAPRVKLQDPQTSKSIISNIVKNYNAAMGNGASSPAKEIPVFKPADPVAPPSKPATNENVLKEIPLFTPSKAAVEVTKVEEEDEEPEYQIEDR